MKTYKFDPHTHTAESSNCSAITAIELVEGYHAAGFSGIAITDHLADYCMFQYKDWDACIDRLMRGYNAAKKRGDELGLDVILGVEVRFDESFCDYLIYCVDEAFLRKNPYLYRLGLRKFFRRFKDKLLVIQAHPYRGTGSPDINFMHGVEVHNGNPRHKNRNNKTRELCEKHPGLYQLSASDTHLPEDIGTGWLEFDEPVADSRRFRGLVMGGGYEIGRV